MSLALANRGKRSLALDIRSEEGSTILHKLLESADVFLTNMRPNALATAGLEADEIRQRYPRLVCAMGTDTACGVRMPTGRLRRDGFLGPRRNGAHLVSARTGVPDRTAGGAG